LADFFRHAFSARESFCARVDDLALTVTTPEEPETFPAPENVALAGAPKIGGCGDGAALHESPESHSGEATGNAIHGTDAEQECAS
jgi:hypothetical protein